MKVLVTGATGQLGYDVVKELKSRGMTVLGLNSENCDITNKHDVDYCFNIFRPDAVIHCAAWTDVNGAESNWQRCLDVNYRGTMNVAEAAAKYGAKMLYVSTDYVFGRKYDDTMELLPAEPTYSSNAINVYGMTKALGEDAVRKTLDEHFIVRISWVFGSNGRNFVKTMLNVAEKHGDPVVVNDQYGRPTYTVDVARLMVDMIETNKYGTYNASNEGDYVTWFGLAQKIYEFSGKFWMTVKPKMTEDDEISVVKRQRNSMMDTNKLRLAGFEPLPSWEDALRRYLEEINEI